MKNDFKHSDERLQEKLEGFRMAAPEGAWAGIEGNIGDNAGGRGKFFYLWMALLFIGVTGAGILTFLYTSNDSDENAAQSSVVASNNATSYEADTNSADKNTIQTNKKNTAGDTQNTTADANTTGNSATVVGQNQSSNASNATGSNTSNNSSATSTSNASNGSNASNNSNSSNNASTSDNSNTSSTSNTTNTSNNSNNSSTSNTSNSSNTSSTSNTTNNNTNSSNNGSEPQANNDATNNTTNGENKVIAENTSSENSGEKSESNSTENKTNKGEKTTEIATVPTPLIENPGEDQIPEPSTLPEVKAKPSWSLEGGIDISTVNMNHSVANNVWLEQALNDSYSQNFAQAAFLRVNYQPFRRFSFHTGLEYAQNKASQDYTWMTGFSTFEYDTTGFYFDSITQQQIPIVDTIELISDVENQMQYKSVVSQIYIPLGAMFHVPLGKKSELGINVSGLVGIQTGTTGEILLDQNGNSIATSEAFRKVNFSARTALRYSYFLGNKSAVYIEPYVGFGLNDRSNTTLPFSSRFRNSGIRVGFRYNF